jgi:hypothetical protein
MPSTCFEPEGSSAGRRVYIEAWYIVFYKHQYKQVCRYKSVYRTRSCTNKTAYSDVCITYHTIAVYTTVFLKMNLRVRNM